jgi:pyruvate/2-oxoglutarate dehydrogenase complex dihydrolipoamide dehydrogenase (E3) component
VEARESGYDVVVATISKLDKAEYLEPSRLTLKGIADRGSGRLLGAQVIGARGVDKRIDVLATAITYGADVVSMAHIDLAYSPPFSTAKDPVHYLGMVLAGKIAGSKS